MRAAQPLHVPQPLQPADFAGGDCGLAPRFHHNNRPNVEGANVRSAERPPAATVAPTSAVSNTPYTLMSSPQ